MVDEREARNFINKFSSEDPEVIYLYLYEILTDSNFHTEAQAVSDVFKSLGSPF